MSATLTATRHNATTSSKLDSSVVEREVTTHALYTVDDLLFNRSQTIPDAPLVAYPVSPKGRADYVHYSAQDLDRFADHGADKYASMGLVPEVNTHSNMKRQMINGILRAPVKQKSSLCWLRQIWTMSPVSSHSTGWDLRYFSSQIVSLRKHTYLYSTRRSAKGLSALRT
jgi:hypothetical protein